MHPTAYTIASTDVRAPLAPQLRGGTRVRHRQSAQRIWPLTLYSAIALSTNILFCKQSVSSAFTVIVSECLNINMIKIMFGLKLNTYE